MTILWMGHGQSKDIFVNFRPKRALLAIIRNKFVELERPRCENLQRGCCFAAAAAGVVLLHAGCF